MQTSYLLGVGIPTTHGRVSMAQQRLISEMRRHDPTRLRIIP
jgi:hypothetical protein